MSRHNILVAIDAPYSMSTNQATSFVAGAIDSVRSNYLAMLSSGLLAPGAAEFAKNLGISTICTSVQSPMRESFVKDEGMRLQEDMTRLIIEKDGMRPAPARALAQDLINLMMRSQLVHPDARAIYNAMPGDPA